MATAIRTENIQTTIHSLNMDFAGRSDMLPDYDESKPIHIHRRNRAFVWNRKMQEDCLDSILKGYYIPPIICCSHIINGTERRDIMEGGNRTTTFRKILRGEVRELTEIERNKVCAHPITMVILRNLTIAQQREMFRRLNKNIKVSDGQLYAMSEEDSPLVREAVCVLNDPSYPIRDRIANVFGSPIDDNNGKKQLENMIAIVSGSLNGIEYITKSFDRQEEKVECQEPINRAEFIKTFGIVLDIFEAANREFPLTNKKTIRTQLTTGKYIGAILYDIHTCETEISIVVEKWKKYIGMVRREVKYAKEAIIMPGAQNINPDKLKRISHKVTTFLNENRIMSEEEVKSIKHTYPHTDESGADVDVESDENDDVEQSDVE
jgi:hypothetical protein